MGLSHGGCLAQIAIAADVGDFAGKRFALTAKGTSVFVDFAACFGDSGEGAIGVDFDEASGFEAGHEIGRGFGDFRPIVGSRETVENEEGCFGELSCLCC